MNVEINPTNELELLVNWYNKVKEIDSDFLYTKAPAILDKLNKNKPIRITTQEQLKEIVTYDPEEGTFKWKNRSSDKTYRYNTIRGKVTKGGYIDIKISSKSYRAHRLAWLYVYGYLPENGLDHIDRDPSNNRIGNLREVGPQCNARNTGNHSDNTSGVKGVWFISRKNVWEAQIRVYGKKIRLGTYKDFTEAAFARLTGEQCLNWSGCDSSSPAYQYCMKELGK